MTGITFSQIQSASNNQGIRQGMRFAVLDDNIIELELIQKSIKAIEHDSHAFMTGEDLMRAFRRESFDFLIVDWELPGISGLEVIQWVRKVKKNHIPILMVTNRQDERDVISGLSAGADDFMCKPIRVGELIARMRALIRRMQPVAEAPSYIWGKYIFTPSSSQVEFNGEPLTLKNREYALALFLFKHQGRLFSRQHLQEEIWGTNAADVSSRSLDTHISAIRNKLKLRAENGYHLSSIYGFGYRLEKQAPDE